jgi:hypothetical protein
LEGSWIENGDDDVMLDVRAGGAEVREWERLWKNMAKTKTKTKIC